MADRVTQAALYAVTQQDADVRVTQAALYAVTIPATPLRVTQAALYAVTLAAPDCLSTTARLWRITPRALGSPAPQTLRFTDHSSPISYGAETYGSCDSLTGTAYDLSSGVGESGDFDLSGIVSDTGFSEGDLYAGLYDGATVEMFEADWSDTTKSPRLVVSGVLGALEQGDASFKFEVFTQSRRLTTQPILSVYTASCRWRLGDSNCTVNVEALRVSGAVTSIPVTNPHTQARKRVAFDTSRTEADGYFQLGVLTWVTGDNAGRSNEVKYYAQSAGEFQFWDTTRYDIKVGDQYTVVPGCDKRQTTCINQYSNVINFGGFPYVPGQDALTDRPSQKGG